MPIVSVIMPVFNSEAFLDESIKSILAQEEVDFEFIIIDDASTDNSVEKIEGYQSKDSRVKLINNPKNGGRAACDNIGIKHARGKYIAKMDSDDICHPERLKKQVDVLENNPSFNVVGSFMQNFGDSTFLNTYPENPEMAKCLTLFTLPVGNPSVMLRAELFKVANLFYDENLRQSEDYDFFARYINELNVYNIQSALINYRTYNDTYKNHILQNRRKSALMIQHNLLTNWQVEFSPEEFDIHEFIAFGGNLSVDEKILYATRDWLLKLKRHNQNIRWFEVKSFEMMLAQKWFDTCYNRYPKKTNTFEVFNQANGLFGVKTNLSFKLLCKFILKNIVKQ